MEHKGGFPELRSNKFDPNSVYTEEHITRSDMVKNVKKMISYIKKLNKGETFTIYQHEIWTRYNSLEEIWHGFFANGLSIHPIGVASTTLISGNIDKTSIDHILNYHYDLSIDRRRDNLGMLIPNYIIDNKGRKLNFALEANNHPIIPWREGYISSLLDLVSTSHIPEAFSLFYFYLDETINDFSFNINLKAYPFLNKKEKAEFKQKLLKELKYKIVEWFKFMTEEEYETLPEKDFNKKIKDSLVDFYHKTPPYENPDNWEFP